MLEQQIDSESVPRTGCAPYALTRLRKVLLVANTGWYLYNFRRGLLQTLLAQGVEVVAVCPRDKYVDQIEQLGARWIEWPVSRSGMNPFVDWLAVRRLRRIFAKERPDLVNHFTIKPILYGTVAARLAGTPRVVNNVTGLGHIFLSDRWPVRAIRPMMRRWYAWSAGSPGVRSIFQNGDDLAQLAMQSPIVSAHASISNGSGVDIDRFSPTPATRRNGRPLCVLFAGRLIREKGIHEFVEAARLVRQGGNDARFVAFGTPDPGNPSSITPAEMDRLRREEVVALPGHTDAMETRLQAADIVVLPSHGEGCPRILIEAAAAGKPAVTCDVPGCRDVVQHGKTGLLVPPKDPKALGAAIESLLSDRQLRERMGAAARQHAVAKYDERHVVSQALAIYNDLASSDDPRRADRMPTPVPKGLFVFSLDFELAWGTRGRPGARHVGPYLEGTRIAIKELLDLFAQFEIPGTWAIVGAMLLGNRGSKQRHPWLDSKAFADVPAGDSQRAPGWYADDVLESILAHPVRQEIACHTLTHEIVDAGSDGRRRFAADIGQFRELIDRLGIEQPVSFIFPRHVMAHYDLLAQNGFTCIRGPEDWWFEKLPGRTTRAFVRMIDARLARPPHVGLPRRLPCGLWVIPPSQFYSPFMGVGKHVSVEARVRKALKGLRLAAEKKRIFHLWTHPFNLGCHTKELMQGLDVILAEARRLADAGEIEITTMGALAGQLEERYQKRRGLSGEGNDDG